jgi:FkbM family methyltransferase
LQIFYTNLFLPGREVMVRAPGFPAPIALRSRSSDFTIFGEVFTGQHFSLRLTSPAPVIIDAGANIGLASIYFANRYPQATILALEPEQGNFIQLCKNTTAYPQVQPIQCALWNEATELILSGGVGHEAGYRTWVSPPPASIATHRMVKTVTIPQLMEQRHLETIDLLKIDIEGAEKEIFAACGEWIDRVGVIIIELHDFFRRGCALSFYTATQGFELEFHKWGHVIVARSGTVLAKPWLGSSPE